MFDPVASMSLKHSYALLVYMHIPDIPIEPIERIVINRT